MREGGNPLPVLHVVTNDEIARRPHLASGARDVAQAGAVALHARAPGSDGRALLELARVLGTAVADTDSLLLVNDRVDVARVVGSRGVHLPAGGLPVADARRILGPRALIGRSAHSAEEARRAQAEGADYVFLGPIWETASHPGRKPLGPEALAQCAPARVIAIGGITAERAPVCREAGAYGVAVITAVWNAADPGGAAREILLSFGGVGG
jgi:thiamine-phosphate pyrophosphorylase